MYFDQHLHSRFSQDGTPPIADIAAAALRRGMTAITITDHFDLCDAEIGYQFYLDHESARREEFERVREQYAGRLEIGWGLEIGHPYQMPDVAARFLESRSFDFILGSVHFLRDGSDIYLIDYDSPATIDRVFTEYFTDMLDLIDFGGFDSLAHLDYPLRVMRGKIGEPTVLPWRHLIEPILEKLVEKGIALELNTRGFMDWKKRQEPEDWVLRRYYELGGRLITIGSDAHVSDAVGVAVPDAAQKAYDLGFREVAYYRNREPTLYPLQPVCIRTAEAARAI